jgi:hypothetical protein
MIPSKNTSKNNQMQKLTQNPIKKYMMKGPKKGVIKKEKTTKI